jgi:hypothetical protein
MPNKIARLTAHSLAGDIRRDTKKGDARASVEKGHDRRVPGRAMRSQPYKFL